MIDPAPPYPTRHTHIPPLPGVLPVVPSHVRLHRGLFEETLPEFLAQRPDQPLALVNIDCDLYSSTVTALELLAPRVIPGTVVIFD